MSNESDNLPVKKGRVFDALPIPMALFDDDGNILDANPTFLAILGVDDREALSLVNLFDEPLLTAAQKEALEDDIPLQINTLLPIDRWVKSPPKTPGPRPVHVELSITPMGGNEGGYVLVVRDITETVEIRRNLDESVSLYQDFVETSDELIWQCDREGRYAYVNPAWELVLGYTPAEMMGRPFTDFMTREQAEKDISVFQELLNQGVVKNYETVHIKKNGEAAHLSFNAKYMRDENGAVLGTRGIAADITAKKQAETELRESRHRYQQLVQSSPMGMHFYELVDGDLIFSDYNPAADALLGVSNAQFLGKTIEDAFPPLRDTEVPTRYRTAAEEGIPWSTDQVAYDDNQIVGAFEVHAFQISSGRMAAVFQDITARKKAEVGLKNEKERIAVTLRSIGDGVIATDTEGHISVMNKEAETMTGWSFEEAKGQHLTTVFNIVNELTEAPCENPVDKVLRTGGVVELANHTVLIARDGRRLSIADSGAPIFDWESKIIGTVLVFRDVTEKTRTAEALQRSQKLESLGILAGGIAHDFNNLLGGIFGYIDLAKEMSSEERVKNYLEKAFFTMNRAMGLTRQLLTFSKGGEPILQTTAVTDLVKQSATFALSGANVGLKFDFDDNLWYSELDENQIGQVVDNIVINAQQAMPLGGEITIRARNITLPKGGHPTLPAGNYVRIAIEDCGVGIQKEILPKIFDPFFTTKQKGSGLGLATCYSIVQKHGGAIEVSSELGKGTSFHIFLPALEGNDIGIAISETPAVNHHGTILVLDDEDFLREILCDMLDSLGYKSRASCIGEETVALYKDVSRDQSVVAAILDLTVPGGMGGQETAKALHDLDPTLPVFVSSGYSDDPVMASPKNYGFVASIAKPYRKQEISDVLAAHLSAPSAPSD